MPQHKSAEKQVRISKKANLRNRAGRSKLKTVIRAVIESKDKKIAQTALVEAVSLIDKSVGSGLIHKNNASNKKSRLYSYVNKLAK
jgi:small subunit ribosomal protein S20